MYTNVCRYNKKCGRKMKKLLWIGSYVSGSALTEARFRGYRNPASVQSQKNLLEGLEEVYDRKFDTIGALVLPPYPTSKIKGFEEIRFSHAKGASDILVGFANYKYISVLSAKRNLVKHVKVWALNHIDDQVEVYIYEMRSACLEAGKEIKKIIPSAKIHLIVPDLPAFMDLRMNKVKKILKRIDWKSIKKNMDCINDFILYAETMVDFLKICEKKWMVMEGSINIKDIKELPECDKTSDKFIVMYSGHVEERFGIKNLAEAFQYLPKNFELWVTGNGNAAKRLEDMAKTDPRIKYYGFLASRDELLKLQSNADVFVNMRDPEEKASHYCFPSKLFEYMLTGKMVLSCKLRGIPEEYFDYIFEMRSMCPKDIANAIINVAKIDSKDIKKNSTRQRNFIIKNKNNLTQAKRIHDFVK